MLAGLRSLGVCLRLSLRGAWYRLAGAVICRLGSLVPVCLAWHCNAHELVRVTIHMLKAVTNVMSSAE